MLVWHFIVIVAIIFQWLFVLSKLGAQEYRDMSPFWFWFRMIPFTWILIMLYYLGEGFCYCISVLIEQYQDMARNSRYERLKKEARRKEEHQNDPSASKSTASLIIDLLRKN